MIGFDDTKYLFVWLFYIDKISAAINGYLKLFIKHYTCMPYSYPFSYQFTWYIVQVEDTFDMSY